jgi:hypothetical protein
MLFSIRPHRRFPVHCFVACNIGPFLKQSLAYFFVFGSLVAALVLSGEPVHAEWVLIPGTSAKEFTTYVDSDTIRRRGDLVKVWTLKDLKTVTTTAGISYLSIKDQIEFDCAEERFGLLAGVMFSGSMGAGTVVCHDSYTTGWQPVSPESIVQTLSNFACGRQ